MVSSQSLKSIERQIHHTYSKNVAFFGRLLWTFNHSLHLYCINRDLFPFGMVFLHGEMKKLWQVETTLRSGEGVFTVSFLSYFYTGSYYKFKIGSKIILDLIEK